MPLYSEKGLNQLWEMIKEERVKIEKSEQNIAHWKEMIRQMNKDKNR